MNMQMRQRPKSGRQGSYLSLDSQHLGSHLRVHSHHHLSNVSISIIFSSRSTLQQGEFLSHSVRSHHPINTSAPSPDQHSSIISKSAHQHQPHLQSSIFTSLGWDVSRSSAESTNYSAPSARPPYQHSPALQHHLSAHSPLRLVPARQSPHQQ